jgi:apolipoprotein N-acyltransferase
MRLLSPGYPVQWGMAARAACQTCVYTIMTEQQSRTQTPVTNTTPAAPRVPGLRLSVLAGVLLWLSYPSAGLWPLAWVALFPLITGIHGSVRPRQAAWRGYVFGWIFLGSTWYWTGLTIVAWTGSVIGWAAWFGLTMLMAGYYALWANAAWRICHNTAGPLRVVLLAASWAALEWLRTLGTLSMPWAQLAYSQAYFLPIIQAADIIGTPGVSFVVALFSFALFEWRAFGRDAGGLSALKLSALVIALTLAYGMIRLAQPEPGELIKTAAVQPNFKVYRDKASPQHDMQVIEGIVARAAEKGKPQLWVLPESASPLDAANDYRALGFFNGLCQKYGGVAAVGSRVVDPIKRYEYNSSVLIDPASETSKPQRYDKQHLVPFGEFIPYREMLPPFLDSTFQFPPTDVVRGEAGKTLKFKATDGKTVCIGPFICYESMYPGIARDMALSGANLLITQSNDDWSQSAGAMQQHVDGVVLRAVENRRSIVRATLTGISCIIDSRGRIVSRAPADDQTFVEAACALNSNLSIYSRIGDAFAQICLLFTLWQVWCFRRARLREPNPTGERDAANPG